MTILVTGSAGFIGFHLSRRLLDRGDEVVGLDSMNAYYDPSLKASRLALLEAYPNYRHAKLDLADPSWERTPYNQWKAYARSKLALLCFTIELNRRLQQRGSRVIALAAHPGFAATDIGKDSAGLTPSNPFSRWFQKKVTPLIPVAADAARPIVRAACSEDARGADYYGPSGFLEIAGRPGRARLNPIARDAEVGRRLWAVTEALTGIRYLSLPD